ncbi:hypothetical protein DFJ73DRAFT_402801 [Zopfochytrium polystomum]|nr:hypothetical protein DFJ73DRAFT_402801 [Zopfochytrium polystomum]
MPVQKSGYLFRMNVPAGHRDAVLTEASGLGLTRSLSSMWKNRRTAAADSTRRKSANRVNNPTSDRPNISAEESALDTLLSRSQSQRTIQARHQDVEANASGDDGSDAPVSSQPTQEPSRSASSGWTLYYVEIRGRYMLFYSVPQAIPASSPGDASASSPGGISAYTGGAYTSSPTTLVSVTFEEPPPPPPPTSIVDSSGNTPTPPLQQVPSRGWRLGPRPLTPTRDPRVGDGRDRKSANSESSSGLNRIIESISYSTRNAAALAKRRMSIFTPALQAREPVVHHPKVTQRRSFEVGAGGLPSPSLIKNGPKTLSHYVDLRGASLEMAPSRNQSIFSATTHIMKLSLADDAILLDLFDELTWESHITANEMTVSSVGSVYGRPTPASKTVECGEWISAVNAANGSPPLIISSRDSSRGSIGSARRPTNLTAPKFPDIRKSQSANSASSAALEHAKRSESPVAMSAGQGLSSKPSISRFFSRQRKTSVESVVFDYRRESPVPPLPTPPHQPMTTSPFAVGEPSAPSSARPMDISQTTPSSGVSSGPSRNLSFKSRSRGVLSQKSRPPPAPAEVSNFTAGDQTDISTTAARSKSKEGRSTTLNGSTLVQPVASVTETHKSETSTAATAPTQSSHRDSATSSKVFNGLRSRNQRQTGSENASSQHTQEGVPATPSLGNVKDCSS